MLDDDDAPERELTVSRCTKAALQRNAPDLSPKSAAAHMSHNTFTGSMTRTGVIMPDVKQ
jgi:hypothetical protein